MISAFDIMNGVGLNFLTEKMPGAGAQPFETHPEWSVADRNWGSAVTGPIGHRFESAVRPPPLSGSGY